MLGHRAVLCKLAFCLGEIAVFVDPRGPLENVGRKNSKTARDVCKNLGGLTGIDPRWRNGWVSIFRGAWPLGGDYRGDRLKSILSPI